MGGRGYPEDLVLPAPGSDVRHHVTEPDDVADPVADQLTHGNSDAVTDQLTHGEPDDVADQQSVPDGLAHGNSHSVSDRLSDDVADPVAVPDGFSDDEADQPHQAEQAW